MNNRRVEFKYSSFVFIIKSFFYLEFNKKYIMLIITRTRNIYLFLFELSHFLKIQCLFSFVIL